jgi:hypothetical protein
VESHRPGSQLRFALEDVQPPADLYVGINDRLRIRIFCQTNAAINPVLETRILKVDGTIAIQEENLAGIVVDTEADFVYYLPEGFILNVCLKYGSGVYSRGQVYAIIELVRGGGAFGVSSYKLANGYLSALNPIVWPDPMADPPSLGGGAITKMPITAAAGADFNVLLPPLARGRLIAIYATLTTAAGGGTRAVVLNLGFQPSFAIPMPSTQVGGLLQIYTGGPGIPMQPVNSFRVMFPTPIDFWLGPGGSLVNSVTSSIAAGDQWAGQVTAELAVDG